MKNLPNTKLIILLLLLLLIGTIAFKQNTQSQLKTVAAPSAKQVAIARQFIEPNPNSLPVLKNPFKPLEVPLLAAGNTNVSSAPILTGIVSQNNEFLAIISAQGKSDFYKINQPVLEYTLAEINSTSVLLHNERTQQQIMLHLKE